LYWVAFWLRQKNEPTVKATTAFDLSSITLSSGTLSPKFSTAKTSYTATVTNSVSSITVTPVATSSAGTIKVNGKAVTSGSASLAISLGVGTNTVTLAAIPVSGTTKIYTIVVTRQAATAAQDYSLTSLSLSSGMLSPAFSSGQTSYTSTVTNSIGSLTITAVATGSGGSIKIHGKVVNSGKPSGSISLSTGNNTIIVAVKNPKGKTTTYQIKINREKAVTPPPTPTPPFNLTALSLSLGSLSPSFNTASTSYTATVTSSVSSITVTPTATGSGGNIKINGKTVKSGSVSGPVSLVEGANTITIAVKKGNTTTTYTVIVTRESSPSIPTYNLTSLTLSSGTLSPSFNTATISYTASVANGNNSITITPTAVGDGGTITVDGKTVVSGSASKNINLSVGVNTITIIVTPTGGSATTYTIVVTREEEAFVLSALTISSGTLNPVFNTNTTDYAVSVAYATASVTVAPTTTGSGGNIKVDGSTVQSGNASNPINLSAGSDTPITVVVKKGNDTTTYTITVTRAAATYTLSGLTLSSGSLSPSFSSGTTSYTATVANAVSTITVTPLATGDEGVITVNGSTVTSGNASAAIALSVGSSNIITVIITPTGGSATTYTITVTRQAAPPTDTYYVSTTGNDLTGDGSQSNPWATPGYGSRQLMSAGDTLVILGGTYILSTDPDDVITPTNEGTSGNPITIQGESGNRPVLKGTNNLIRAIDLSGRDYITLENIEITNNSLANFRNAIDIYTPATNIILKDLYIHHIDEFGINIQDVDGLTIEDSTIEYCGFGAIGGPDMGSGGGWKNITVDNCDLSYNGHYYQGIIDNPANPYGRPDGIGLEEGPGPIEVKNCLVEHNVGDGIDLKLSNCHVHENIVANNSCDGIKLWAGVTTAENNLVYGTGDGVGGASPWAALVIGAPAGETFIIQNNTFHGNPSRQGYISYMQYDEQTNINITLRNNIFSNAQGLVWLAPQITGYIIENNLFNRNGSTYQIYVGGSDRTVDDSSASDLNNLATASSNITGDPKFVSPAWGTTGDYHCQSSSPTKNAGTSTGTPSIDLDGTSRPQGSADDIGAYEQ